MTFTNTFTYNDINPNGKSYKRIWKKNTHTSTKLLQRKWNVVQYGVYWIWQPVVNWGLDKFETAAAAPPQPNSTKIQYSNLLLPSSSFAWKIMSLAVPVLTTWWDVQNFLVYSISVTPFWNPKYIVVVNYTSWFILNESECKYCNMNDVLHT